MSIDTNVNNYTIDDLLSILKLDYNTFDKDTLLERTNRYINLFEKKNNYVMVQFFKDIQEKLYYYLEENTNEMDEQERKMRSQTDLWYGNQALEQRNRTQRDKITDRTQKIDVYENEHVPMNREQLGVSNNVVLPVAQDVLNPNLKNVTNRFIILDSQYRQTGTQSTDYTLDLSDHLNDVLSVRLYSFQIPMTWYTIDEAYNNTCFWIQNGTYNIPITIISGNYNPDNLVSSINQSMLNIGFYNIDPNVTWGPVSYNSINGKITIQLKGVAYNGKDPMNPEQDISFNLDENSFIIFFDYTANLMCNNNCINQNYYINQTLGWVMGYRLPYISVDVSGTGNIAPCVLDLIGTRYLILIIDDFNQNHLNNGLVSITEMSKTLKLPSYYTPDLPYNCPNVGINLQKNITNTDSGIVLMERLNTNYIPTPNILPTSPRVLTQSQIYTINEIMKNNDQNTNYRAKAPTNSDVFALIPVKPNSFGSLYVEFSGSLQDFKRNYFGPVNIDRLKVTLLDDKGNILNLNGSEWTITLISENLYQY